MVVVTVALLWWNGQVRLVQFEQSQAELGQSLSETTATGIERIIADRVREVTLFVDDFHGDIDRLASNLDDDDLLDQITEQVVQHFPGAFTFTLADPKGNPLLEDIEGLVGDLCRVDIRQFSLSSVEPDGQYLDRIFIHPQPFHYHFDIMIPWKGSAGTGVFFVSFEATELIHLIAAHEVPGQRIYLERTDAPGLIEVSSEGTRNQIDREMRFSKSEEARVGSRLSISGTRWSAVVIPDVSLMDNFRSQLIRQSSLTLVGVIVIGLVLVVFNQREERRRTDAEKALERSNAELDIRVHQRTRELNSAIADVRENELRFRTLIELAPFAIVVIDRAGHIRLASAAAYRMFGVDEGDLLERSVDDFLPEELGVKHIGDFDQDPEPRMLGLSRPLDAHRLDGTRIPVEIGLSPAYVDGQQMIVAFVSDISERRAAELLAAERAESLEQSNQELEQFAYVASHDLREPLRMISSYLGLLSRRYTGQLDDDADEFIHFAVDGAARMSGMIEDLLQYSRIGTQGGELHPTNSGEALSEVLRDLSMAIEEGEAQIEVGDMPWVMADSTQLRRLLSNLIGNALKYRGEAIPEISIHSEFKNSRWEFTISDNGIGIDPEFHDRIFRIFQRLHGRGEYSGSGLGLAVCRKIVERHGGQIWVESRPLGGSLFVFTLGEAQSQKEAAKEF